MRLSSLTQGGGKLIVPANSSHNLARNSLPPLVPPTPEARDFIPPLDPPTPGARDWEKTHGNAIVTMTWTQVTVIIHLSVDI